jgi:hypothetical protein
MSGILHEYQYTFLIISRSILLILRHFSDKFAEKMKTQFVVKNILFYKNCTIYEIMWKNMLDPERPQVKILRMRITCG